MLTDHLECQSIRQTCYQESAQVKNPSTYSVNLLDRLAIKNLPKLRTQVPTYSVNLLDRLAIKKSAHVKHPTTQNDWVDLLSRSLPMFTAQIPRVSIYKADFLSRSPPMLSTQPECRLGKLSIEKFEVELAFKTARNKTKRDYPLRRQRLERDV